MKSLLLLLPTLALIGAAAEEATTDGVAKATGPPPFFLQDSTDSLCLVGEEFRRCSIDTLFFVVGSPGSYQIHKRPSDENDADPDGTCLSKKSCDKLDADAAKKSPQVGFPRFVRVPRREQIKLHYSYGWRSKHQSTGNSTKDPSTIRGGGWLRITYWG